jgi:alpha,alpha-trehalase
MPSARRCCCPSGERSVEWLSLADRITADTSANALHPTGRWQCSPGDERPDAALVLAAIRGAIPANDPRSIATLRAIEDELTEQGYCYRYRPDERPLGQSEGGVPAVRLPARSRPPPAGRFGRRRTLM